MSKDPAFLFYTSDFLTGTMTMTDDQVGKFIRLLCLQHQKGDLSEKDMLFICKTYDEDIYCKFDNVDGKFRNQRLFEEVEKRRSYSESRRNNRKKKETPTHQEHISNISKTYVQHMENENEDENVIDNKIVDVVKKAKKTISIDGEEIDLENAFEQVWKAYNGASSRQAGSKAKASLKWMALGKNDILLIREHLPKFIRAHVQAKKTDYFPDFVTYLNQRRFEDEKLPYQTNEQKGDDFLNQFK